MAMLAEPRRKQRYVLNPRGSVWSKNDDKIGQKMLEKMGWSKGKGIGKFEQGEKDHISIHFKDNTKGIGFKGKDDEWVKHYEGFENVLAALNSENNSAVTSPVTSNANSAVNSEDEDSNHTSLESLSKRSQARVHYSKFTRGKDLSRLSSDDIECITGSKRAKILTEISKKEEEIGKQQDEKPSFDMDPTKTINRGSMKDYFAMKMSAFKSRTSHNESKAMEVLDVTEDEPPSSIAVLYASEVEREMKKEKRKRKNQSKDFDDDHKLITEDMSPEVQNSQEKENKEQKKRPFTNDDISQEEQYFPEKKSKEKKKKRKKDCQSKDSDGEQRLNLLPEIQKSHEKESKEKKKKRKMEDQSKNSEELITTDGNQSPQEMQNCNEKESYGKKKKKKRHNKESTDELKLITEVNPTPEVQYSCETEHKKKKKERKKDKDHDNRQGFENSSLAEFDVEVKSKKHKKKKNSDMV